MFPELRDMLTSSPEYKHTDMKNVIESDTQNLITWVVGNTRMDRKNLQKILKQFYQYRIFSDFIQDGFSTDTMSWFNEPSKWETNFESEVDTEGYGGSFEILEDGQELVLRPPAKKDFWRKTYYTPMLIKNDGSCFLRSVPANLELTMEVFFTLRPSR